MQPCPTETTLRRCFLAQDLDTLTNGEVKTHVEGCSDCQTVIENIMQAEDSPDLVTDCNVVADRKILGEMLRHSPERAIRFPLPPTAQGPLGQLDLFHIQEQLGGGTYGVVFRVFDEKLACLRALKVLRPEWADIPALRERFLQEARAVAAVRHPGVVNLHAVEDARALFPQPFLVMEYVEGSTLTNLPKDADGRLTAKEAVRVAREVAQGLAAAHGRGVIHRDVKPDNILIEKDTRRARLADFGVARFTEAVQARFTEAVQVRSAQASVVGTPAYMSLEAFSPSAEVDGRSDLYSLGVVLYQMLTGQLPYSGTTRDEIERQVNEAKPISLHAKFKQGASARDLAAITEKLLAPQMEDRYQTAASLAVDLEFWEKGQPVPIRPHALTERVGMWRRREPVLAITSLVMFFLMLALGIGASLWAVQAENANDDLRRANKSEREAKEQTQRKEREVEKVRQKTREAELIRQEEKKHEAERTRTAVGGALKQAVEMKAKFMFAQARTTLTQTQKVLGPDGDQMQHKQIKVALDNLAFVEQLDRIRQDKSMIVNGKLNVAGTPDAYAAAFKKHGFDMVEGEEEALVNWVVLSPLRDEVVAALDDWFSYESNRAVSARLYKLTLKITGHAWREGLPAKRNDRKALEELLAKVPPQEMTVAMLVGLCEMIEKLGGDSVILLERARLRYPGDFWLWFELGTVCHRKGKESLKQATGAFYGCLAIRPESAVAWYFLGSALGLSGDRPGAIAGYKEAIRLDRKFALAHTNLGIALMANGDLPEAIAALKEAISVGPNFALAHASLGLAFARQKQYVESFKSYQAAFAADKSFWASPTSGLRLGIRLDLASLFIHIAAAEDGKDGCMLNPEQKSVFRKQALDLLRADLAAWDRLLLADPKSASPARKIFKSMQTAPNLASVRDEQALAKLPLAERPVWRQFWVDVVALLLQADKIAGSKH